MFIQGDAGFTSHLFDADTPEGSLLELQSTNSDVQSLLPESAQTAEEGDECDSEATPEEDWQANVNLKWSGKRRTRYASTVSQNELKTLSEQSSLSLHFPACLARFSNFSCCPFQMQCHVAG